MMLADDFIQSNIHIVQQSVFTRHRAEEQSVYQTQCRGTVCIPDNSAEEQYVYQTTVQSNSLCLPGTATFWVLRMRLVVVVYSCLLSPGTLKGN